MLAAQAPPAQTTTAEDKLREARTAMLDSEHAAGMARDEEQRVQRERTRWEAELRHQLLQSKTDLNCSSAPRTPATGTTASATMSPHAPLHTKMSDTLSYTVKSGDGEDKSFSSYMDARRCFSDLTFKYRGAGAGKVELMLGEDVKEVFDAANQISPEAKAGAKKTKKRTGTATKARKAAAPKKSDDGTEKVAMLDGERVKKPSSSYMFFNKARSAELRAADSSMGMGDVSKAVAKAWKEVSDDDKAPFVAQATADKARYEDELSRATVVEQVSKKAAAAAKKRKATDKAAFLGGKKTPKAAAAPSPSKAAAAKAAAKTKAKAAEDAVEDLTEEQLPAEAAVAAALKANALP